MVRLDDGWFLSIAGMAFTSAGTGVTSTTWFLDDVRIGDR